MRGPEGTNPAVIAQWIINQGLKDKNIHLWLITDGEIDEHSLLECKSLNHGISYQTLTLVTINEQRINNSISFAFFNIDCVITMYEETGDITSKLNLKTKDFDFTQITLDNVIEKFEEITDFIISKFTINTEKLNISHYDKTMMEKQAMAFIENLKLKKFELIKV